MVPLSVDGTRLGRGVPLVQTYASSIVDQGRVDGASVQEERSSPVRLPLAVTVEKPPNVFSSILEETSEE